MFVWGRRQIRQRSRTLICTLRHGETDHNVNKRYAGTLDIPLNGTGVRDAEEAAVRLASLGIHFDVVVASSKQRSIRTAEIVTGSTNIIRCDLCDERDYGEMQGLTPDETEKLIPRIHYVRAGGDYHSINPPGGESFTALRKRVRMFHRYVLDNFSGRSVLVVSHGTFLQQFHGLLQGKSRHQSLEVAVSGLELTRFTLFGRKCENVQSLSLIQERRQSW